MSIGGRKIGGQRETRKADKRHSAAVAISTGRRALRAGKGSIGGFSNVVQRDGCTTGLAIQVPTDVLDADCTSCACSMAVPVNISATFAGQSEKMSQRCAASRVHPWPSHLCKSPSNRQRDPSSGHSDQWGDGRCDSNWRDSYCNSESGMGRYGSGNQLDSQSGYQERFQGGDQHNYGAVPMAAMGWITTANNAFGPNCRQWRCDQMQMLDNDHRDHRDSRKDRCEKFSEDFSSWRNRSGQHDPK